MEEYESCEKCLQYLDKIEDQVRFRDAVLPTDAAAEGWKSAELLKHYNRAIELLPEHWNDENYVIISVRHALLLLSVDEMNATTCINLIRINCNKAQVSVAMAEYYLIKHDREGALVCLERAQQRHAQPTELIEAALAALTNNAPSLSHLIDARFCYEPPDEVASDKNETASMARPVAKHQPRKVGIASGDHSFASKFLKFPPEQLLIAKPLRVPKKRQDSEEPLEPSEPQDAKPPGPSGELRGAAEAAAQWPASDGGEAKEERVAGAGRPLKAPQLSRKVGQPPSLPPPLRVPKKLQDDAANSRHSASLGNGSSSATASLFLPPPPPPPLPRPVGGSQEAVQRAPAPPGLAARDPEPRRCDKGSAAPVEDKENYRPHVGSDGPVEQKSVSKAEQEASPPPVDLDPNAFKFGVVDPWRKNVGINGQVYNISKVIGRGGSSVVYEARKGPNGEICAIKLVSFVATEEKVITSYKNEVEMLLRLQQTDKIIRLFDHEIQAEGMALVMERAETDFKSVHAHLLAKGGDGISGQRALLPANQCLSLWREMLECVASLHENGIVHLDLKPGNFVLVKGVPKLIDLGISHSIPEDRTSVTLQHQLGTIDYMSPEQLPDCFTLDQEGDDGENVKKRIGRKSDVWALGCILYLLMFGRPPFRGVHLLKRLQSINSDKPVPIPDYPAAPRLKQALQMCLQRDPNARASVADLLAFLDENPS